MLSADHNANSFALDQLEEFVRYEVIMQSYNDVGSSRPSAAVTERTREAGEWWGESGGGLRGERGRGGG